MSDRATLPPMSRKRRIVCLALGVILPLACTWFDPIVFRSSYHVRPLLAPVKVLGYLQIALGVCSLSAFLLRPRTSPFLAGVFLECAVFSTILGCVMLPATFAGLFLLIGVLGFTPFFAAAVYWQSFRSAWGASHQRGTHRRAVLGFMIVLLLAGLSQLTITRITNQLVDRVVAEQATQNELTTLARLAPVANLDPILRAYDASADNPERRERYEQAYERITGRRIDADLWLVHDDFQLD